MPDITDLAAGTAGEHLVCADLLLAGYRAFLADQNCPYDIAVEAGGRLVRVQVKATRGPRVIPQRVGHITGYMWHVGRTGKRGSRVYAETDFDVMALVALDTREIAYLPSGQITRTVTIRPTGAPGYQTTGVCARCGCDVGEQTRGCMTCLNRHWRRRHSGDPQGRRFVDFPFVKALA